MIIILYISLFIILCLVLIKSTAWVTRSLISLAKFLNWSKFFISFILMAFVTTLPELIVGISSGLNKASSLSLGNVLGSNIVNLTLILGITAIISGQIMVLKQITLRSASFLFLIAFLPLFLIADFQISRLEGIILIAVFFIYLHYLVKHGKKKIVSKEIYNNHTSASTFLKAIFLFLVSSGFLLASAWGITKLAINIASSLNMPLFLIGLLGVALGTSLPELSFALYSVVNKKRRKHNLHLGNLLGSVAVNASLILGVTALISPIRVDRSSGLWSSIIFTILTIAFFNFFMRSRRKISRKEGIALVLIYVVFLLTQVLAI